MSSLCDIDHELVQEAARRLGVSDPVRVLRRRYNSDTAGRYIAWRDGVHVIGVQPFLSARQTSRTLWHELTHALQAERLGSYDAVDEHFETELKRLGLDDEQAFRPTSRRYGDVPLEREALGNERLHRHLKLAHRAPRRHRLPWRAFATT